MPRAKKVKKEEVVEEIKEVSAIDLVEENIDKVAEEISEPIVEEKKGKRAKLPELCHQCLGSGLVNPSFVGSAFCPRCEGSCYEPA
jgi:hypothetical protein